MQLLQPLSEHTALVCFPHAGGKAADFAAMADAMSASGVAVYAVELPGHEDGAAPGSFATIGQVVAQVVSEVRDHKLANVMLWGHSSGAAAAIETAHTLEQLGIDVQRLFIGAELLGTSADRRARIETIAMSSDAQLAAALADGGSYTNLDELADQHRQQVLAAYRHDCVQAHRSLLTSLDRPAERKLAAPITVVVADDDPTTTGWRDRYSEWAHFSKQVDVRVLAEGGHHFVRTRPTDAASVLLPPRESTAPTEPIDPPPAPTQQQPRAQTHLQPPPVRSQVAVAAAPKLEIDVRPGKPAIARLNGITDAVGWATSNREAVRSSVAEHGALLIRGLPFASASGFRAITESFTDGLMPDLETFAPRESHAGNIYSSSVWQNNQPMRMHNEVSYRNEFPALMLFGCAAAPLAGGAIELADSPSVLESLPTSLVNRFTREGWILTRNYSDEMGLSIAEAFGTSDRSAVEAYCQSNAIEFEWRTGGGLRTSQRRSAVIGHPITGQHCWFNQVAFLNEWTMKPEVRSFLLDLYGPGGLPFNTHFGNGDPVDEGTVAIINDAYEANTRSEPLRAGDLMIVDNIRTAHSRQPFEGERKVFVALADPMRIG